MYKFIERKILIKLKFILYASYNYWYEKFLINQEYMVCCVFFALGTYISKYRLIFTFYKLYVSLIL